MDRVYSKFERIYSRKICVKVAYFIMYRNRLKLRDSQNNDDEHEGKEEKNCVKFFHWKKCVSKNVIICSKVEFLFVVFFAVVDVVAVVICISLAIARR